MKKYLTFVLMLFFFLTACSTASPVLSQAGIEIYEPYAHAAGVGETSAAYMRVKNTGSETDTLLSATCEQAMMVEVMESMMMEGDVMSMGDVPGIDLPAGRSVELKPGSYHIMLMDMKQELIADSTISLTLEFEKAGKIVLEVPVLALGATP